MLPPTPPPAPHGPGEMEVLTGPRLKDLIHENGFTRFAERYNKLKWEHASAVAKLEKFNVSVGDDDGNQHRCSKPLALYIQAVRRQLESATAKLSDLRSGVVVVNLEKKLATALREREEARAELIGHQSWSNTNLENAEALAVRATKHASIVQAELTATKAALAAKTSECDNLRNQRNGLEDDLAKQEQQLSAKQQECEELRASGERRAEILQGGLDHWHNHAKKTLRKNEELEAQLTAEQQLHGETRIHLTDAVVRADDLAKQAKAATKRAESAEKLADGLSDALGRLKTAVVEIMLPAVNASGTLQTFLPEQFQWSKAVELTDSWLAAHQASRAPRAGMAATEGSP